MCQGHTCKNKSQIKFYWVGLLGRCPIAELMLQNINNNLLSSAASIHFNYDLNFVNAIQIKSCIYMWTAIILLPLIPKLKNNYSFLLKVVYLHGISSHYIMHHYIQLIL